MSNADKSREISAAAKGKDNPMKADQSSARCFKLALNKETPDLFITLFHLQDERVTNKKLQHA